MTEELITELQELIASPEFVAVESAVNNIRLKAISEPQIYPHVNCMVVGASGIRKITPAVQGSAEDMEIEEPAEEQPPE